MTSPTSARSRGPIRRPARSAWPARSRSERPSSSRPPTRTTSSPGRATRWPGQPPTFPAGAQPEAALDLLVLGPQVPARLADAGRGRAGAVAVFGAAMPAGRHVLLRRDRARPGRRHQPLPQRDLRDAAARDVSDDPARASACPSGPSPEQLRKESRASSRVGSASSRRPSRRSSRSATRTPACSTG